MALKYVEAVVNNSSGVFLIKMLLEILDKSIKKDNEYHPVVSTEKDIRSIFTSKCRSLGIKLNGKGGISGLGFDVSVILSIFEAIGLIHRMTMDDVDTIQDAVSGVDN